MSGRVCAVGYTTEKTFGYAVDALQARGVSLDVVDLSRIRDCRELRWSVSGGDLLLEIDNDAYSLAGYHAFYQRCYYAEIGDAQRQAVLSEFAAAVNAWLATAGGLVINRPFIGESNHSKLYHLAELRTCGFAVPETHLLSDPAIARRRILPDMRWVSKGCSGARSEVRIVDRALYGRFGQLGAVPALFQQKIDGPNVRVHALRRRCVGLRIDCSSVDYRYPGENDTVEFSLIEVPMPVRVAMQQYLNHSGLAFAGFDFRIDAGTGAWYVLEANPMPGFDYYDRRCGGAITAMLAEALTAASAADEESLAQDGSGSIIGADRRHTLAAP